MHLLFLGDYIPDNTRRQMEVLVKALPMITINLDITVKPHPACPINIQDYPEINMTLSDEPIANLLDECDWAYTSTATSAAVDAYCAGVHVISFLDSNTLNLSPLRGFEDVTFISEAKELAMALMFPSTIDCISTDEKEYFIVDIQLPRWRKLLTEY